MNHKAVGKVVRREETDVADIVWSFANCNLRTDVLLREVVKRHANELRQGGLEYHKIAKICESFARLGYFDPQFFRDVTTLGGKKLARFRVPTERNHSSQLDVLWAFVIGGCMNDREELQEEATLCTHLWQYVVTNEFLDKNSARLCKMYDCYLGAAIEGGAVGERLEVSEDLMSKMIVAVKERAAREEESDADAERKVLILKVEDMLKDIGDFADFQSVKPGDLTKTNDAVDFAGALKVDFAWIGEGGDGEGAGKNIAVNLRSEKDYVSGVVAGGKFAKKLRGKARFQRRLLETMGWVVVDHEHLSSFINIARHIAHHS